MQSLMQHNEFQSNQPTHSRQQARKEKVIQKGVGQQSKETKPAAALLLLAASAKYAQHKLCSTLLAMLACRSMLRLLVACSRLVVLAVLLVLLLLLLLLVQLVRYRCSKRRYVKDRRVAAGRHRQQHVETSEHNQSTT
jgi:Flp pilus assembly protein TadB